MLNDWKAQLANTRKAAGELAKHSPKLVQAYQGLAAAQNGAGALDPKTRELIAMAVAVGQCDAAAREQAKGEEQFAEVFHKRSSDGPPSLGGIVKSCV